MACHRKALARTFAWHSVRRSLLVALLIGTVLNAINQGGEMLSGYCPIWWKLVLTYFVPLRRRELRELCGVPKLALTEDLEV
jgi:hypothetical protein